MPLPSLLTARLSPKLADQYEQLSADSSNEPSASLYSLLLTANFNTANASCQQLRRLGHSTARHRLGRFQGMDFELRLAHAPLEPCGMPRPQDRLDSVLLHLDLSTIALQYRPLDPDSQDDELGDEQHSPTCYRTAFFHQLGLLSYCPVGTDSAADSSADSSADYTTEFAVLLALRPDGSPGNIFLCATGGCQSDMPGDPFPFARNLDTYPPTERFTLAEVHVRRQPAGGGWAYDLVPASRQEVAISATAQPVAGGSICPDPRLHYASNMDGIVVAVWAWLEADPGVDRRPVFSPVTLGGCHYWG